MSSRLFEEVADEVLLVLAPTSRIPVRLRVGAGADQRVPGRRSPAAPPGCPMVRWSWRMDRFPPKSCRSGGDRRIGPQVATGPEQVTTSGWVLLGRRRPRS